MSAGQFNQIDPAKGGDQALLNENFRSYNFDVIDGVTYQVDVTKPAKYNENGKVINADSSRIINLSYEASRSAQARNFSWSPITIVRQEAAVSLT